MFKMLHTPVSIIFLRFQYSVVFFVLMMHFRTFQLFLKATFLLQIQRRADFLLFSVFIERSLWEYCISCMNIFLLFLLLPGSTLLLLLLLALQIKHCG